MSEVLIGACRVVKNSFLKSIMQMNGRKPGDLQFEKRYVNHRHNCNLGGEKL